MRNDEKLSYLIVKVSVLYQTFLLTIRIITIDITIDVMKSIETSASLITSTVMTIVFEAQISELKDQINNLNLNVNPSPDKIANSYYNKIRYNRN